MKEKKVMKVLAAKNNLHQVYRKIVKRSKNQNRTKYRIESLKMLLKVQLVLLKVIKLRQLLSANKMKMVH